MITLQTQIEDLGDQLEVLRAGSENKTAMQEYAVIIEQLDPVCDELKRHKDARIILGKLPGDLALVDLNENESEQLVNTQALTSDFKDLWNEDDYKARQSDSLDNVKQSIAKLNSEISGNNQYAWNNWIEELVANFDVADAALDSQEDIPGLIRVINKYKEKRNQFRELTTIIPDDAGIIDEITTLAEYLINLKGEMDFNLPEEVKKFFEYMSSPIHGHQFPLESLKPEVKKWLIDNNEMRNYVIKRKGHF